MTEVQPPFRVGRSFPGIATAKTLEAAMEQRRVLSRVYGTPRRSTYIWALQASGQYILVTQAWVEGNRQHEQK
jgi:hypothetical protein